MGGVQYVCKMCGSVREFPGAMDPRPLCCGDPMDLVVKEKERGRAGPRKRA
jgi:hypothetical protein